MTCARRMEELSSKFRELHKITRQGRKTWRSMLWVVKRSRLPLLVMCPPSSELKATISSSKGAARRALVATNALRSRFAGGRSCKCHVVKFSPTMLGRRPRIVTDWKSQCSKKKGPLMRNQSYQLALVTRIILNNQMSKMLAAQVSCRLRRKSLRPR